MRRWGCTLAAAMAIAGLVGFIVASSRTPTYESSAVLLVGPINTDRAGLDTLRAAGQIAETYAQLATSRPVIDATERRLALPDDSASISARASEVTRLLTVKVRDQDPERGARIANAHAKELVALAARERARTRGPGKLQIVDPAQPVESPSHPAVAIAIVCALTGLLGLLGLALMSRTGQGLSLARVRTSWMHLREDAAAWDISPRIVRALFLLPVVGGALVVASRADKSVFVAIADEDGLLEWLQFIGFAAASVFALGCARRLQNDGRRWLALAYLLFALGCFFTAGEEVSWGQRIIGYGTPESLEQVNEQEEVTIHNIGSIQNAANAVCLLVGLYGSIGAWLIRSRPRARSSDVVDLLVPPLFLTSAFFVVFAYKFLRATVVPESGFTVTQIGEWSEFCLALGFSVFPLLVWRRLGERLKLTAALPRRPQWQVPEPESVKVFPFTGRNSQS
jgi:capsular polysaccharide biosynthesis protein